MKNATRHQQSGYCEGDRRQETAMCLNQQMPSLDLMTPTNGIFIAASMYHPLTYHHVYLSQTRCWHVLANRSNSPHLDPATICKMSDISIGTNKIRIHRCMVCGSLIDESFQCSTYAPDLLQRQQSYHFFHLVSTCLRLYGGSKPFRKPSTHTPHELRWPKFTQCTSKQVNMGENRWV